jgi:tRNA(fMet)-specific endonuclease VapC
VIRYLFDTDVCIELIRRQPAALLRRLDVLSPGDVGVSSITEAELEYGAEHSAAPGRNRAALVRLLALLPPQPFTSAAAAVYGRVRHELETAGHPIGPLDTLIAAHALQLGLTLVTGNIREFRRVPGLRVESWR